MTQQHGCNIRHGLILLALLVGTMLTGAVLAQQSTQAFVVELTGMNSVLTGTEVTGQANLIVNDGKLFISLVAKGLPPNMEHLGHIHGFMTDQVSTCPDSTADTNGDGIVDLLETEPAAGVTLIPFNADPAGLVILSDTYPVADAAGLITYVITVSLDDLDAALKSDDGIDALALGNRVIFLHGVPEGTAALPDTAQSLPGVPAYVTVPLACGEVRAL